MASATHVHTEHVLPLRVYFGVFAALLVLTALTVFIARFHFGALNLVVAMAVAAVKAGLVALFFMHLKYDSKVYAAVFITAVVFLAVFIVLTMSDTMTRGHVDPEKQSPIIPEAVIYRQAAPSADTAAAGG
ncbi:MAG TPA: cytochrome C oxidase subunit IV family protein [candidate division Zixibacteria bacterium]|nr:cytochrome C oxidase subunit IV family protein [candidate division Zixibacteria bacterium]MDD4918777.1 cytochrome C oxidase subunit IV family protein [candidate division Zixibacteria bacterium]MDM7971490.1 cytochrome C oxidase subunit IV family protein [candidate division Zixibacteria bacterium]HOD65993.1 cytochrome C oxidase subunit IV family protein [candidate division Zixibacteria bacterium]HOZ07596.1 cytochrome C oxidase subunit IV family protein [candidate division Zixibacteria bacteriu